MIQESSARDAIEYIDRARSLYRMVGTHSVFDKYSALAKFIDKTKSTEIDAEIDAVLRDHMQRYVTRAADLGINAVIMPDKETK